MIKPFNYELDAYLKKNNVKFYLRPDGLWLSKNSKALRITSYRKGVSVELPLVSEKIEHFEDIETFIAWFEKL